MPKHPNPCRIKRHRIYSVCEAAQSLGLHRQKVIRWIKDKGLAAERGQRPWLIEGAILKDFLRARRSKARRKLGPAEIYCLPCRAVRRPAAGMAEYRPLTPATGQLIGLCPTCERLMHRIVARADLDQIKGNLDVTFARPDPRPVGTGDPCESVNFETGGGTHAKARSCQSSVQAQNRLWLREA